VVAGALTYLQASSQLPTSRVSQRNQQRWPVRVHEFSLKLKHARAQQFVSCVCFGVPVLIARTHIMHPL
jgi:hypothetical protein